MSDRTLRRAIGQGALRAVRPTPRTLQMPLSERDYVRRKWPLLSRLRGALRTEPNVRFALLFGSVATGADTPASDVDILVDLRDASLERVVDLVAKLEETLGRHVDVVGLAEAETRSLVPGACGERGSRPRRPREHVATAEHRRVRRDSRRSSARGRKARTRLRATSSAATEPGSSPISSTFQMTGERAGHARSLSSAPRPPSSRPGRRFRRAAGPGFGGEPATAGTRAGLPRRRNTSAPLACPPRLPAPAGRP